MKLFHISIYLVFIYVKINNFYVYVYICGDQKTKLQV